MRAIVIATGLDANLFALNERYPAPMLPLVGRPFVQHVVETLVDQGVTEFDFILSHLPERLETFLGTGARWGARFRFHLARNPARAYNALKALSAANAEGAILLAHADRLPQLPDTLPNALPNALNTHGERKETVYCLRGTSGSPEKAEWTGWALLSNQFIATLPDDLDEAAFEAHLMSACLQEGTMVEVPRVVSVRSYEELLAAQSAVLTKEFSGLMLSGSEVEPGIWLARNVSLHPTAELVAPVFVGENCRIGMRTQLGPNAVIGNNCVLDARCTVTNSIILPGSYVGEALELEDVLVDKNLLVNARLGAAVPISDDFILGSLADNQIRAGLSRLFSRLAATVLLVITWPVLLATAIYLKLMRRGPVLLKREYVRLPAPASEAQWRTFQLWSFQAEREPGQEGGALSGLFLRFLPALINIVKGELSFVGVRPRSKTEVRQLSHDWRSLYLHTKAGIVTEAEILYGAQPDEDELYSAEAFYSAAAGMQHDLNLLLAYFGRLLKAPRPHHKVASS